VVGEELGVGRCRVGVGLELDGVDGGARRRARTPPRSMMNVSIAESSACARRGI
jgi:hypothetical protein